MGLWEEQPSHPLMEIPCCGFFQMASKIPFATDLTDYEKMTVNPCGKVKLSGEGTAQRSIEIRLVTLVYSGLPSSVPLSVQPYVITQHSE